MLSLCLHLSPTPTLNPTELVLIVSAARRQSLARLALLIGPGSLLGRLVVRFWSCVYWQHHVLSAAGRPLCALGSN